MPHVTLNTDLPGIAGLFQFRLETAVPLNQLVETLLRAPNTLTAGERELIAAHASFLNECRYCYSSHSAYAAAQLPEGMELLDRLREDPEGAPISPKLRALLAIAGAVQVDGRDVTDELIAAARAEGATDVEIHDTVLIAAAFCMYNRYVDGLATLMPEDPEFFGNRAQRVVEVGYVELLKESMPKA
jgi:uncharacterized peroxidase-related enzyme